MTAPDLTTVPEVRAHLLERFRAALSDAATELDGLAVVVTYGDPGLTQHCFVAVGSTADGITQAHRTLPATQPRSSQESYGLEIVFWAHTPGMFSDEDQQLCTETVWRLWRILARDLRADADGLTLGGLVTRCWFSRLDDDDFRLDEGRAAQIVATLSVEAKRI